MRRFWSVLLGALTAGVLVSTAIAGNSPRLLPVSTTATPVLDEVRPPIGWIDFCPTHPSDCNVQALPARKISLDVSSWRQILRINQLVNDEIEQVEDVALYGVSEKWTYPDQGKGDCEDIALLKRRMLMQAG